MHTCAHLCIRRRSVVVARRSMAALPPAAGVLPAAFDLVAWARALDLCPEDTNGDPGNTVYLVTLARVLQQTLSAAPHLVIGWWVWRSLDAFRSRGLSKALLKASKGSLECLLKERL